MLKWLTKKTYATLSEVLGAVHKELEELQPVDTDSIKWTKGMEGMRAELNRELLGGGGLAEVQEDSVQPEYVKVRLVNYPRGLVRFKSVVITGYDTEETTLDANTLTLPTLVSDYTLSAATLASPNPAFAVLQEPTGTSGVYTAVVSGPTPAYITIGSNETRSYCALTSATGNLSMAQNGNARVIWRPSSTGDLLCLINVGTGYDSTYFGQFKVGFLDGSLYLYDGAYPTSSSAGLIYTGSVWHSVPKTLLTQNNGYIYVGLSYDPDTSIYTTAVYQGDLASSPWYGDTRSIHYEIATYSNGIISQIHTTGAISVTGRWV